MNKQIIELVSTVRGGDADQVAAKILDFASKNSVSSGWARAFAEKHVPESIRDEVISKIEGA